MVYDHWDIDDDNDGIWDYLEVDSNDDLDDDSEQNQGISSSVQIVLTKMMTELIQTQMMMVGTNLFGTKEYWVKDYYSNLLRCRQ